MTFNIFYLCSQKLNRMQTLPQKITAAVDYLKLHGVDNIDGCIVLGTGLVCINKYAAAKVKGLTSIFDFYSMFLSDTGKQRKDRVAN